MTSPGRSSSRSEGSIPSGCFRIAAGRMGRMNNNGWQQARYEARLATGSCSRPTALVRMPPARRRRFRRRSRSLLGHANHSMAGHYASADVGRLLKQANLVLNRSGTQTILARRRWPLETDCWKSNSRRGESGFARQVHESRRVGRDRWITGSTEVPQQTGGPGFGCQVLDFWRARQESNPRPPGS